MNVQNTPTKGHVKTDGLVSTAVVFVSKQSALLARCFARNGTLSTAYLQFHDTNAATLADGTVPTYPSVPLAPGQYYESDTARTFKLGCAVCLSSTPDTKNLATGTFHFTGIIA